MKVRFTNRGVRVRIDDLELARLLRGERLLVATEWPGGGWTLILDPQQSGLTGEAGLLSVGLSDSLAALNDPAREGVTLAGPPRVDVEKDFGPGHA